MSIYENNMLNINGIANEESNAWQNAYSSHSQIEQTEYNRKGKWSPDEDDLLSALVKQYDYKNWKKIAQQIKGRTAIQCLHRWSKILQPGLVKGPWTTAEDAKLIEWVEREGPTKWSLCSETIQGRSGKQCREHWNNSLCPNIKKGMWSPEEDFLILFYYKKLMGSWKKISPFFIGRTENSIKNRFFSQLRKIASGSLETAEKKMTSKIKLVTLLNFIPKAYDISVIQMKSYLNLKQEEFDEHVLLLENDLKKKVNGNASVSCASGQFSGSALQEKETKDASIKDIKPKGTEHHDNEHEEGVEGNEKDKYDSYDLDTLGREIFEQCDNNNFFLSHDNDIDFEANLMNVIDNVVNEQMQVVTGHDFGICDLAMKDIEIPLESHQDDEGGDSKLAQGQSESKAQEYAFLMNRLSDLNEMAKAIKNKLKQFEESDPKVFL